MSTNQFRLYTFVAGLYLSDLQKGLQTAHVVSEISRQGGRHGCIPHDDYSRWADKDKTIIICNALNHKGVLDCWAELQRLNLALCLPAALFREDEESMNGMATACGVIVPEKYWAAQFERHEDTGLEDRWVYGRQDETGKCVEIKTYTENYPEGQFIKHIKQYRLA